VLNNVCRDDNQQSLKIGRQSYKIRENRGDRYIRRTDRAEGVLIALRQLDNTTILFTVLIFVLLHIFLNIFFTFITPICHIIVQRLVHREFVRAMRK